MFSLLLRKIIGSKNERELRRMAPLVERINGLEPDMRRLSDAELSAKTPHFKERIERGEGLDEILPEAFAVVREVARRTLGERHFDVQLMGGIVLHQGKIAEMKTGEGKTLVATLPVYLNALTGRGVHLVTVNDYLAKRDAEWMGPIYKFLGLSVGCIQHQMDDRERKTAYACDVTYGTNNEFGFDYLRDNMKFSIEDMVQRELHYAIVDEVDSILIDEARTPLIISGPAEEATEIYYMVDNLVQRLKRDKDFTVDEKTRTTAPTEDGVEKVEKLLKIDNLYDPKHIDLLHHINQALKAHHLFKRDVDYVVKEGKVIIVDEFTGRLMPGRRYSDGLHQALEAKERVRIENENQTLATITFQNYFRMYEKLAGMTGTADTEAAEFAQIYNLDVVVIPTNKPMIRIDNPDVVYRTGREKFEAVAREIRGCYERGQPVLVGTCSIEKSERLSSLLKRQGIPHQVLNAKHHEKEAEIVAQAGRLKTVTIATNMAGRGVDILLGGNPKFLAKQELRRMGYPPHVIAEVGEFGPPSSPEVAKAREEYRRLLEEKRKETDAEHEKVVALGGLHIIGTERHESRRVDNQLRGRSGRQGDPGSSRFYLSLEDDLLRIFGSDRISGIMARLGMEEGVPIEHNLVTRAIESAQKKVEAHNFDIRKHLLEYDNVMNQQRQVIYDQRRKVLADGDIGDVIYEMMEEVVEATADPFIDEKAHPEDWDTKGLRDAIYNRLGLQMDVNNSFNTRDELIEYLIERVKEAYNKKEQEVGRDAMRQLEKIILLSAIDHHWKDHLLSMDHLKEGIGLRGYGQRDPLQEYKREAFDMFMDMTERIKSDTIERLFKIQLAKPEEAAQIAPKRQRFSLSRGDGEGRAQPARREGRKVGRNDPCPCGSGLKYKRCCGR